MARYKLYPAYYRHKWIFHYDERWMNMFEIPVTEIGLFVSPPDPPAITIVMGTRISTRGGSLRSVSNLCHPFTKETQNSVAPFFVITCFLAERCVKVQFGQHDTTQLKMVRSNPASPFPKETFLSGKTVFNASRFLFLKRLDSSPNRARLARNVPLPSRWPYFIHRCRRLKWWIYASKIRNVFWEFTCRRILCLTLLLFIFNELISQRITLANRRKERIEPRKITGRRKIGTSTDCFDGHPTLKRSCFSWMKCLKLVLVSKNIKYSLYKITARK